MAGPDPNAQGVIDYFKRKVEESLAKVAEWQRQANSIAADNELPPVYVTLVDGTAGTTTAVRPDQYANYSAPGVAARAFLDRRTATVGSASLDQVFAALKDGGYQFSDSDADAKAGLKIALGKDLKVRQLSNGTYGLWEWYPDAKRPRVSGKISDNGDASETGERNDKAEKAGKSSKSIPEMIRAESGGETEDP